MTQDTSTVPAQVSADEAVRVAPEGQITMTHPDSEGYGYASEQAFAEVWEPKGWTRVDPPADSPAGATTPAPASAPPTAAGLPAGDPGTVTGSRRGAPSTQPDPATTT